MLSLTSQHALSITSPCSALTAGCERCRGALTQRRGAGYMAVTRTGSRQSAASSNCTVKVSLTSQPAVTSSYLIVMFSKHHVQSWCTREGGAHRSTSSSSPSPPPQSRGRLTFDGCSDAIPTPTSCIPPAIAHSSSRQTVSKSNTSKCLASGYWCPSSASLTMR